MEVQLAGDFLPLLLLAWLPAGLTHQISARLNASVELDLVLQCLLQTGSHGTAGEVKCFNTTQNNGETQNKGGVEMQNSSVQLVFTGVNKAHPGMCTWRMENRRNVSENGHSKWNKDASQPEESDVTLECRFKIWLENLTVKWYKPASPEVGNQTNTMALGENCTHLTNPGMCAANMGICGCRVFITRLSLTDAGNGMQGTVHGCGPGVPQFNVTDKNIWTGLNFPLCMIFGLVIGTLLYMPIIGLLLLQHRRNRKGKLVSTPMAEGNQLSTAAPVTGTEDLTYANLKFEKKETKPTSSDVIYTKIKPSQQKQSGGDAGAANAGVDVSCEGEDK